MKKFINPFVTEKQDRIKLICDKLMKDKLSAYEFEELLRKKRNIETSINEDKKK